MESFLNTIKFSKTSPVEIPSTLLETVGGGRSNNSGKSLLSVLRINPRTKTRKLVTKQPAKNLVCCSILSWEPVWKHINSGKDISASTMSDLHEYFNKKDQFSFLTSISDLKEVLNKRNEPLLKNSSVSLVVVLEVPTKELYWIDTAPIGEPASDDVYTELESKKTVMSKYLGNKLWCLDTYGLNKISVQEVYMIKSPTELQKVTPDSWEKHVLKGAKSPAMDVKDIQLIFEKIKPKLTSLTPP